MLISLFTVFPLQVRPINNQIDPKARVEFVEKLKSISTNGVSWFRPKTQVSFNGTYQVRPETIRQKNKSKKKDSGKWKLASCRYTLSHTYLYPTASAGAQTAPLRDESARIDQKRLSSRVKLALFLDENGGKGLSSLDRSVLAPARAIFIAALVSRPRVA